MRRRLLIALGLVTALLGTGFAAGSADRCGAWPPADPVLLGVSRSEGPLKVGAAKVELRFPGPVTVGGYAPWRSTATSAASPLFARALVLETGGERLGLVLLDVLLVAPELRDRIAADLPHPAWVLATHTHSGPGGFDTRPAAQLAGLGAREPAIEGALVEAARKALVDAAAALAPASLVVHERTLDGFARARSGETVDQRLTTVTFAGAERALAELVVVSAHPTLVPRRTEQLDPDWPGAVAALREANAGPLTFVLQGAGGNASIDRERHADVAAAATALVRALPAPEAPATPPGAPTRLAWADVRVGLPRPDASRLVPGALTAFTENLLCDGAEDTAVLHALRLGSVRLLFAPVEPSHAAGLVLEEQAKARRVVSLSGGYAGYVETEAAARAGSGESRRQYFPPELLTRLAEAARLAGSALGD